ncbi:hypothetical protein GCM10009687_79780 [Asanoa iriomotensis]|uniref:Uncharacterized protein n=1 Tax=Asanoa iriomotensis TaxID=234613 RepID=A0ABQ4C8A4_9ACTN|nr:hypothetical protein Air01nite_51060 [Asanoa iriomotensis]
MDACRYSNPIRRLSTPRRRAPAANLAAPASGDSGALALTSDLDVGKARGDGQARREPRR